MYIINEENHSGIAVVRDPFKAVGWLLDNDWLSYNSCGINEEEEEIQLWEVTGFTELECKFQPYLMVNYFKTLNLKQLLETLEMFGFYFSEIEDIDYN